MQRPGRSCRRCTSVCHPTVVTRRCKCATDEGRSCVERGCGDAGTGLASTIYGRDQPPGGRAGRGGRVRVARAVDERAGERVRRRHLGGRGSELHVLQPRRARPARRLRRGGPGFPPLAALQAEVLERDDGRRHADHRPGFGQRHRERQLDRRGLPDAAGRRPRPPRPRGHQPVRPPDDLFRRLGRPLRRAREQAGDGQPQPHGRGPGHQLAQRRRRLPGAARLRQADPGGRLRHHRRRAGPARDAGR